MKRIAYGIVVLFFCNNICFGQQYMIVDTLVVFDSKFDRISDVARNTFWFVSKKDFATLESCSWTDRKEILKKYKGYTVEYFPCLEEHSCLPHDYFSIEVDSMQYEFGLPYPNYSIKKSSFEKGLTVKCRTNPHNWSYTSDKMFFNFYTDHRFIERLECFNQGFCNERFSSLIALSTRVTVEVINNFGDKIVMYFDFETK